MRSHREKAEHKHAHIAWLPVLLHVGGLLRHIKAAKQKEGRNFTALLTSVSLASATKYSTVTKDATYSAEKPSTSSRYLRTASTRAVAEMEPEEGQYRNHISRTEGFFNSLLATQKT